MAALYGNQPFEVNLINDTICTKKSASNGEVSFTFKTNINLKIHYYCYDRGTPKGSTLVEVNETQKHSFVATDTTSYLSYTISLNQNDILSFVLSGFKNDNAICIMAQVV